MNTFSKKGCDKFGHFAVYLDKRIIVKCNACTRAYRHRCRIHLHHLLNSAYSCYTIILATLYEIWPNRKYETIFLWDRTESPFPCLTFLCLPIAIFVIARIMMLLDRSERNVWLTHTTNMLKCVSSLFLYITTTAKTP